MFNQIAIIIPTYNEEKNIERLIKSIKHHVGNALIIVVDDSSNKKISEIIKNKKVIIFGLPGAYTSVCSVKHLPGYIRNVDQFRSKDIDKLFVFQ